MTDKNKPAPKPQPDKADAGKAGTTGKEVKERVEHMKEEGKFSRFDAPADERVKGQRQ